MTRHDAANAARAILATLALTLLLGSDGSSVGFIVGLALWCVTYLWTTYRVLIKNGQFFGDVRIGTYVVVRILLMAGVLAVMSHVAPALPLLPWLAAAGVLGLISIEGLVRRAYLYTGNRVVNLPGADLRPAPASLGIAYVLLGILTPVLFGALALLAINGVGIAPLALWLAPVLAWAALAVAVMVDARSRRSHSRVVFEALPGLLEEYAPRFVFYWDAPRGTAYQVGMWLPYLQRLGEPFFIMVRNPSTFAQAVSVSDGVPVILARTMAEMDRLVPETLTTAFYANNGAKNAHFVRYPQLTHVQLLHGDSDKASSYNPVTAMFDKIYVAGQAGIDRYVDHGVDIPLEKFRIVGRPQVEDITRATESISSKTQPVVLYAPTWRGAYSDASYSSMPVAPRLFDLLLQSNCSIIYRPHPYCDKDPEFREITKLLHTKLAAHTQQTGIRHVYGDEAENQMSVVDCFNACDVMISDVSSVVVDFLYSEKPFALVSMGMTAEQFVGEFPLARASYVMLEDPAAWPSQLEELLRTDPLAQERSRMRVHYLGDFAPESYAEGFIAEARRQVLTREKTQSVHGAVKG